MDRDRLEERILDRGKELFATLGRETPSVFNKDWWTGRLMDWSMSHEDFKLQLFRFIDVLPCLTSDQMLADHIREYFSGGENVPAVLRLGAGEQEHPGLDIEAGLDLWQEVRRLPRRQAQAIALVYLNGLARRDVAEVLGCSEETVKTHLDRARKTLSERLGSGGEIR